MGVGEGSSALTRNIRGLRPRSYACSSALELRTNAKELAGCQRIRKIGFWGRKLRGELWRGRHNNIPALWGRRGRCSLSSAHYEGLCGESLPLRAQVLENLEKETQPHMKGEKFIRQFRGSLTTVPSSQASISLFSSLFLSHTTTRPEERATSHQYHTALHCEKKTYADIHDSVHICKPYLILVFQLQWKF